MRLGPAQRHQNELPLDLFFFNDTATTEIYPLSLHDALPISRRSGGPRSRAPKPTLRSSHGRSRSTRDRKSTRLNSSHVRISYGVFCLKKNEGPEHDSRPSSERPVLHENCIGAVGAAPRRLWAGSAPRLASSQSASLTRFFFFNYRGPSEFPPLPPPHPLPA